MLASPQPQKMTASEYLEWEPRQELRYEYCDGKVFARSGGTKTIGRVTSKAQPQLTIAALLFVLASLALRGLL